ncbi:MAG: amidohydrolase [Alphaproteobacteria bacterium]|nr:amidohydrolase [Alphaproteobacteria bacterium]
MTIPHGIISADSHIVEPPHCYVDFIEPKYRDTAPRVVLREDGGEMYVVEGQKKVAPIGFIDGAGYTVKERLQRARSLHWSDVRPGSYDGKAREADQNRDGIAAEIIYASLGMVLCTHPDMEYKAACMLAYNRWLQSFCADLPDRLFGLAMTPVRDVDSAIEDFRRAKDMGHVGMMMPGNPGYEDYDHPDYDALWQCAVDLDLPVCFHILTSRGGGITDNRRGHAINGFLGIIRAVQDVVGTIVLSGVFERNPKLKLVCAEGDAGWMPHYRYRMDHAAFNHSQTGIIRGLTKLPSEYLKTNVWMTFQDDWVAFQSVAAGMMDHSQLLWANDFPHTDSTWPRSQSLLAKHTGILTETQRQDIMRNNVARVFNLPAGNLSWQMQKAAE